MKSGTVRMNGGVPGGVAAKTTTARSSGLEKTVSSSPVARGNRFPMGPAKPKAPVLGGSASKSAPVLGGSATKSGGLQIRATGTARPAATPNVRAGRTCHLDYTRLERRFSADCTLEILVSARAYI